MNLTQFGKSAFLRTYVPLPYSYTKISDLGWGAIGKGPSRFKQTIGIFGMEVAGGTYYQAGFRLALNRYKITGNTNDNPECSKLLASQLNFTGCSVAGKYNVKTLSFLPIPKGPATIIQEINRDKDNRAFFHQTFSVPSHPK